MSEGLYWLEQAAGRGDLRAAYELGIRRRFAVEFTEGRISAEEVCAALLHFATGAGVVQAAEMLAALKRWD